MKDDCSVALKGTIRSLALKNPKDWNSFQAVGRLSEIR